MTDRVGPGNGFVKKTTPPWLEGWSMLEEYVGFVILLRSGLGSR